MNQKNNLHYYFEKKFKFKVNEIDFVPKNVYTTTKWIIPKLQKKKNKLNEVKGQLSNFNLDEWSKYTKFRDPSSFIIKFLKKNFNTELVTQAWCKFYECLSQYKIIPNDAINTGIISTVHLCEAPGGFISSLNHYLTLNYPQIKWNWLGNTLNPEYEGNSLNEMIPDDRLICCTYQNWYFGCDMTGDITKYYNHLSLINEAKKLNKVWIVTADGSVDCMLNPGDQEKCVEYLHYCEVITALAILEKGGSFIIKIFTMFEESTVCLLYLLNCTFEEVHVFKPSSSKSGNSEVYLICLNYKGHNYLENIWESLLIPYKTQQHNYSMFDLYTIPENFIQQIFECCDFFMEKQIFTINHNVKNFGNTTKLKKYRSYQLKTTVANHFIHKYKINSIPDNKKLIKGNNSLIATYYNRLWNWGESWCFHEYFIKLNVNDVIEQCQFDNNLHFNIKTGKALEKVYFSNFSSNYNFICNLNSTNTKKLSLYNNSLNNLSENTVIINIKDFDCNLQQNQFQKLFFYKIKNNLSTNKNFVFLGIPFVTNFLVSIIFLLMLAFKSICFYKNGCLTLYEVNCLQLNEVIKKFDLISHSYDNFSINFDYEVDIVSIITFSQLKDNHLIRLLWCYNNNLCKKK